VSWLPVNLTGSFGGLPELREGASKGGYGYFAPRRELVGLVEHGVVRAVAVAVEVDRFGCVPVAASIRRCAAVAVDADDHRVVGHRQESLGIVVVRDRVSKRGR
jgi:hypothetical protein